MSQQADGEEGPANVVIAEPLRSIPPNGTAPIGSEVAEMKQRQATRTQRMHQRLGSKSEFTFPPGQKVEEVRDEDAEPATESIIRSQEPECASQVATVTQVDSKNDSTKKSEAFKTPEKAESSNKQSPETQKEAGDGSESGEETDSEKTFQRVCGMSLKEFSDKKEVKDAPKGNSGASNNSSGG